jgi:hypothetical protein
VDRVRFWHRLHPGRTVLPLALLCASIAGCGPGQGEVSGTVHYNGKPLPFGTIQFLGSDGVPRAAKIESDGTFSVQVPAGDARVIVSCVDEDRLNRFTAQQVAGNRGRAAPPPGPAGNFSLIPLRYSDWNGSGLTVRVGRGKTTQDFDLTSN